MSEEQVILTEKERLKAFQEKLKDDAKKLDKLVAGESNIAMRLTFVSLLREFKHQAVMLGEVIKRMPDSVESSSDKN